MTGAVTSRIGVMYVHVSVTTVTPASASSPATSPIAGELRPARVHVQRHAGEGRPTSSASRRSSCFGRVGCSHAHRTDLRADRDLESSSRAARRSGGDHALLARRRRAPPGATSRLRRDADRMEHRHGAPELAAAADRLEAVLRGRRGSPSIATTSLPARRPRTMAEHGVSTRPARGVGPGRPRDGGARSRDGPRPDVRPWAGTRPVTAAADVDEVAVAMRPRAEDRVREHDRVRLAPRHVLAERGTVGELVGAHVHVGRQPIATYASISRFASARVSVVEPHELGVEEIQRAHVERRRHGDRGSARQEPFGEVQPGLPWYRHESMWAPVTRPQARRSRDLGHPDDQPHRERRAVARLAGEERPVLLLELDVHLEDQIGSGIPISASGKIPSPKSPRGPVPRGCPGTSSRTRPRTAGGRGGPVRSRRAGRTGPGSGGTGSRGATTPCPRGSSPASQRTSACR